MFHLIRHHSPWGGHVFLLWMFSLCGGCVWICWYAVPVGYLNVIYPLIVAFVFRNLRVLLKLDILWPLRATTGEISHQQSSLSKQIFVLLQTTFLWFVSDVCVTTINLPVFGREQEARNFLLCSWVTACFSWAATVAVKLSTNADSTLNSCLTKTHWSLTIWVCIGEQQHISCDKCYIINCAEEVKQ